MFLPTDYVCYSIDSMVRMNETIAIKVTLPATAYHVTVSVDETITDEKTNTKLH